MVTPHEGVTRADGVPLQTDFLRAFEPMSMVGTDKQEPEVNIALPTTAGGDPGDTLQLRAIATRTFGDLFSGPVGVADIPGRRILAGARQRLRTWDDGRLHEVPLSLPNTWIFVPDRPSEDPEDAELDQSAQPIPGCLVMLIDNSSIDAGQRLADEAAAALSRHDWSTFVIVVEPKPEKLGSLRRFKPRVPWKRPEERQVEPIPGEYEGMSYVDDDPQWADSSAAPPTSPLGEPWNDVNAPSDDDTASDDDWNRS